MDKQCGERMIRPTARAALLLLALLGISAKVAAAPTDAAKVQAALSEGRSLAARGDHQGAIVAWKRVFELDSRNCAAASEITVSALALHDLSQAEQSARSAVDFCTVDKQAGAAYYNLALVLLEKGDKAAAITAFGHSLDRHDNPYVHKKLAAVDAQAARRYEERMRLRGPFETLAQQLLASEKGRVVALREMDLDKDGKVERIAYICSDDHVVILIEKDTSHRPPGHGRGSRELPRRPARQPLGYKRRNRHRVQPVAARRQNRRHVAGRRAAW